MSGTLFVTLFALPVNLEDVVHLECHIIPRGNGHESSHLD